MNTFSNTTKEESVHDVFIIVIMCLVIPGRRQAIENKWNHAIFSHSVRE